MQRTCQAGAAVDTAGGVLNERKDDRQEHVLINVLAFIQLFNIHQPYILLGALT